MRPGRPGRCARSATRGWRATRSHPSRIAPGAALASERSWRAIDRSRGADTRRDRASRPPPCRARAAGEGARPRWRRRRPRPRTARCSPPPTCSSSAPPRSSPPTRVDLEAAEAGGMEPGPLDRLRLTDARLAGMADGLRTVAALPDPVGEVLDGWRRPNGLEIERRPRAARRRRDHLREPAQRHERRRRPLPEVGQRRAAARARRRALRSNLAIADVLRDGARQGRPARRRGDPRRRRRATRPRSR